MAAPAGAGRSLRCSRPFNAPVSQDGAVIFFQLVNARHERASTVLTSNKGFEEWGHVLGDEAMAAALHRPAAAPLPHRQHPGQQLSNAGTPALAAIRIGRTTGRSHRVTGHPAASPCAGITGRVLNSDRDVPPEVCSSRLPRDRAERRNDARPRSIRSRTGRSRAGLGVRRKWRKLAVEAVMWLANHRVLSRRVTIWTAERLGWKYAGVADQ